MHCSINFTQLNSSAFSVIKNKFSFSLLKRSPDNFNSGEKILKGVSKDLGDCYLFEYFSSEGSAKFLVGDEGKNVSYHYTRIASTETVQSLIKGSITKFCLQQQGYFCLHASGIRFNDEVILFTGTKGAGKSTLSAYLHLQGYPVWCDDYSVLDEFETTFHAHQGETSLKVNPDIPKLLNIPHERLESVFMHPGETIPPGQSRHIEGKYYFNNGKLDQAAHTPLKVAALFILRQRVDNPVKIVSIADKGSVFIRLMNEMMLPGINSKSYIRLYFNSVKSLLDKVPVYYVDPPDNITAIGKVRDAIFEILHV